MREETKGIRRDYHWGQLDENDLPPHPLEAFRAWFDQAASVEGSDVNACVLSTADLDGSPDARVLLLKSFSSEGFVFFGHLDSSKAKQLASCPRAHLLFMWLKLDRQVRVRGQVSQLPRKAVEAYFSQRPRESQLSAWASRQSEVVESRQVLESQFEAMKHRFEHQGIPPPPRWGGWRLRPENFEFWQGRSRRLHDRIRFVLKPDRWERTRLSP